MSKKVLSDKLKEIFYDYVFNERSERCGSLNYESHQLKLNQGTLQKGQFTNDPIPRGYCDFKGYTPVIFHTHPLNVLSYPSVEDIIKVIINRDEIKYSLIPSKWGIWIVKNIYNDYDDQNLERIKEKAETFNRQLQKHTGIIKYINNQTIMISTDLNTDVLNFIDNEIDMLVGGEDIFDLLLFTWDELKHDKLVIKI